MGNGTSNHDIPAICPTEIACFSSSSGMNILKDVTADILQQDSVQYLLTPSYTLWSSVTRENLHFSTWLDWLAQLHGNVSVTSTECSLLSRLCSIKQRGYLIHVQAVHPSLLTTGTNIESSGGTTVFTAMPRLNNQSFCRLSQIRFCFTIQIFDKSNVIAVGQNAPKFHRPYVCFTHSLRDRNLWIVILRHFLQLDCLNRPQKVNHLQLTLQELKNVPTNKRYFCEVLLDSVLVVRTSVKTMSSMLLWAEKFQLEELPDFSSLQINVYRMEDSYKRRHKVEKKVLVGKLVLPTADISPALQDQWEPLIPASPNYDASSTPILSAHGSHRIGSPAFSRNSQPNTATPRRFSCQQIPASLMLRFNARWNPMHLMPEAYYEPLRAFLCIHSVSLVKALERNEMLSRSTKEQEEFAVHLVRLLHCEHVAVEFVTNLILWDLHKIKEPSLALRGNSVATKSVESFMFLLCEKYLLDTLGEFVRKVVLSEEDCEVDPAKVSVEPFPFFDAVPLKSSRCNNELRLSPYPTRSRSHFSSNKSNTMQCVNETLHSKVAAHRESLLLFVQFVWGKIRASQYTLPRELRRLFFTLRTHLRNQSQIGKRRSNSSNDDVTLGFKGQQEDPSYHVISACLFLRLLCPAILSPSLFGLLPHYPEEKRINRTFTLVAKIIQSLANGTLFGQKESYMTFFNDFLESSLPHMETFLKSVARFDSETLQQNEHEIPSWATVNKSYELAVLHKQLSAMIRSQCRENLEPVLLDLKEILHRMEGNNSQNYVEDSTLLNSSPIYCSSNVGTAFNRYHYAEQRLSLEVCEGDYGELIEAPLATPDNVNLSEYDGQDMEVEQCS